MFYSSIRQSSQGPVNFININVNQKARMYCAQAHSQMIRFVTKNGKEEFVQSTFSLHSTLVISAIFLFLFVDYKLNLTFAQQ